MILSEAQPLALSAVERGSRRFSATRYASEFTLSVAEGRYDIRI